MLKHERRRCNPAFIATQARSKAAPQHLSEAHYLRSESAEHRLHERSPERCALLIYPNPRPVMTRRTMARPPLSAGRFGQSARAVARVASHTPFLDTCAQRCCTK
jgi:hypothetical protein